MLSAGYRGQPCAVPGCDQLSTQKKRALCRLHLRRFYTRTATHPAVHNLPTPSDDSLAQLATTKRRGPKPRLRPCMVPGCQEQHHARGMCKNHYAVWRYYQKQA